MIIQINQELCLGCGVCVDACQKRAIFMDDQKAVIVIGLCNECEACIDVCPNEAITIVGETTPICLTPIQNTDEAPIITFIPRSEQSENSNSLYASKPLTDAFTSFIGNIVAPRMAEMAISVLDRSLAKSPPTFSQSLAKPSHDPTHRMKQRRNRSHGGAGKGRKFG